MKNSLRPTRNTDDEIPVDPAVTEHERQVRQARLDLARRRVTHANWTEIAEPVRRGKYLVDADDLVYMLRRGHVFEPGRAHVGYVPRRRAADLLRRGRRGRVRGADAPAPADDIVASRASR